MASCLDILNCEANENEINDLPPELLNHFKNFKLSENKTADDRDKTVVPEWLTNFESPFLWDLQSERVEGSEAVIQRTLEKVEEIKFKERKFSLQHFALSLKLVLEYHLMNNMEKSWSTMKTVEQDFKNIGNDESCECQEFKVPLGHLVSTTKAHLLMLIGDEERSQKLARNIIPVKVMPNQAKASMWALKSYFYLYAGYTIGEATGVGAAKKALEIDPENAEWAYLLANILRQQRKQNPFCDEVPKEELLLLEKAVAKDRCDRYLIYLAQVYMECGNKVLKKYGFEPYFYQSSFSKTVLNMHQEALKYYKEALDLNPNSASALRRIGYGIMNLSKKVADYSLALHCLEKSLEIFPSLITMHILGTYYSRYAKDYEKALEFFEKTATEECYFGLTDKVRVKYILDPEYDPCKDLQWGLTCKQTQNNRSQLLAQLGAYFLLIKKNLIRSIPYFNQLIEEDRDSPYLKTLKSFFLRVYETINLYHYIANEAMLILQMKGKTGLTLEKEQNFIAQLGCVEELLIKVIDICPELKDMTPDPTLVDKLIKTSKENAQREKTRSQNGNKSKGHCSGGGFSAYYPDRGPNRNQQRTLWEVNSERRSRFSPANQQNRAESVAETRSNYPSENPPNRDRPLSWRQRQSSCDNESFITKVNIPYDLRYNWRKK